MQMLLGEVAQSRSVDKLYPAVFRGFRPATAGEPGGCDQDSPSGALLVHCADQFADVAHTDHSGVFLGLDDCEASDHGVAVDDDRIDTVISAALGGPPFQSPRFEQLPYEVLEFRGGHLGEIGSGIEAGN